MVPQKTIVLKKLVSSMSTSGPGPIRPYFGDDDDDDDDNDETDIQSTHGRPPFTLPATATDF